ncbi:hypothetical protein B7493_12635, partial [Mycobacterium tuberculosis variant bovis]
MVSSLDLIGAHPEAIGGPVRACADANRRPRRPVRRLIMVSSLDLIGAHPEAIGGPVRACADANRRPR